VIETVEIETVEIGQQGPPGIPGWFAPNPTAVPGTESPTSAQTGSTFTNEDATGDTTVTLPEAAAGLIFTFYVLAAEALIVTAAEGDTIRIGASETVTGGSVTSSTVGSSLTLMAMNENSWCAVSAVGTWA